MKMKNHAPLLSMLSALLDYPDQFLLDALREIRATVSAHPDLPAASRRNLCTLIDQLQGQALLDLQEAYVDAFDRGRASSLYLFEHVHGESRDRGQAMIDLLAMYERKGLFLGAGELPDYLPVFLEFLSREDATQARGLLLEIADINRAIASRLAERGLWYWAAVAALLPLAGEPALQVDTSNMATRSIEPVDTTELDKQWQDEPVNFMGSANPLAGQPQPIKFYDKRPT